jgi:methanogenic corrinoid protein MtbC1
MFDIAGFTVHDLGRDVPLEKFVEEQLRTDSEIVALSAMMTTTMMGMKKVIEMIKEKNPNVAIMLGGAPVTKDTADLFGADGYAESAIGWQCSSGSYQNDKPIERNAKVTLTIDD